jgi:hypothetical protein
MNTWKKEDPEGSIINIGILFSISCIIVLKVIFELPKKCGTLVRISYKFTLAEVEDWLKKQVI